MNNKGISTIVATVLIVLITVAAVTILWAAISPMLNVSDTTSCVGIQNAVTVDSNAEFTNYKHPSATETYAYVRVKRGAGTEELQGLKVVVDADGETVNATTYTTGLPAPNGGSVYTINITENAGLDPSVVSATVTPIIEINGENTECTASASVTLNNKTA